MPLFTGLSRSEYQDVLRAVGWLVDRRGWRRLRLVERGDGLLLQGHAPGFPPGTFVTRRLDDEEVLALLREAYAQRDGPLAGARPARGAEPRPAESGWVAELGYQRALRAVGRLLDEQHLECPRLVERGDGLLLQAKRRHDLTAAPVTALLSAEELRALAENR